MTAWLVLMTLAYSQKSQFMTNIRQFLLENGHLDILADRISFSKTNTANKPLAPLWARSNPFLGQYLHGTF